MNILARFKTYLSMLSIALIIGFTTSCGNDDDAPDGPDAPTVTSITSFAPTSGFVGTSVTITGTGFSSTLANNTVRFGSVTATVTAATATSLTVTVPEGATTNPITVLVTEGGVTRTAASVSNFQVTIASKPIKEIEGTTNQIFTSTITGNQTWSKDTIYVLKNFVRVGGDNGSGDNAQTTATLTIEPGTIIFGDRETKGSLIVQRGSKIIAQGTAEEPIIFTSERPVGQREPGDWGGVVICGYADNNQDDKLFELEGGYGAFSGGKANIRNNDDSGIFEYVRIEYAGVAINPNQEINSLTMGAVGSGTKIDYVQCSFGLDDSFEWFGGTVNSKYLIAYRGLDDDLDVDFGYSGNVQYALCIRGAGLSDQSGSNGFEVDNQAQGADIAPYTSGTFSNISIIGPKANRETTIDVQFQSAAHLRRSNRLKIHNSFFTGYPNGILIDGPVTVDHATEGELVLKNNILAGVDNWGGNGFGSAGTIFGTGTPANGANHPNAPRGRRVSASGTALSGSAFTGGAWTIANPAEIDGKEPEQWFLDSGNQIINGWNSPGSNLNLNANIFLLGTPSLLPGAGSILLSGADFTGLPSFFTTVTFRGAFGTTDWTAGWAEWNPTVVDYLNL